MGLFVWDALGALSARKNPHLARDPWKYPKWRTLLIGVLLLVAIVVALIVISNLIGFNIVGWPSFLIAVVVMYELAVRFDLAIDKRRENART